MREQLAPMDVALCVISATRLLRVIHRTSFRTSIPLRNVLSIRVGAGGLWDIAVGAARGYVSNRDRESLRDAETLRIRCVRYCRPCIVWLFERASAPRSWRVAQIHGARAVDRERGVAESQDVGTHIARAGRSRSHQS